MASLDIIDVRILEENSLTLGGAINSHENININEQQIHEVFIFRH